MGDIKLYLMMGREVLAKTQVPVWDVPLKCEKDPLEAVPGTSAGPALEGTPLGPPLTVGVPGAEGAIGTAAGEGVVVSPLAGREVARVASVDVHTVSSSQGSGGHTSHTHTLGHGDEEEGEGEGEGDEEASLGKSSQRLVQGGLQGGGMRVRSGIALCFSSVFQ